MFSMIFPPSFVDLMLVLGKSLNMHTEATIDTKITFIFLVIEILDILKDGLDSLFFGKPD